MLYKLNTTDTRNSERMQVRNPADFGLKEKHLEDFFANRLDEVMQEDRLLLIGKSRQRQEEADLFALDETGTLYIFELKRWESEESNILQVMRYGQKFGRYDYSRLDDFAKRQGHLQGDSLREAHQVHFDLDEALPESHFNHDQVFVLITNGLDGDTISAVQYWREKGLNIECAPYSVYDIAGEPYIQFDTYSPESELVAESNQNVFVVNTCRAYRPEAWQSMLGDGEKGKASAYYGRKHSISRISKGDSVYLYHSRTGVIAKGIATSDHRVTDCDGDAGVGEEFYIPLDFSGGWTLQPSDDEVPRAWQINGRLGTSHRFRQTVFGIDGEMAKAIDDIHAENCGAAGSE